MGASDAVRHCADDAIDILYDTLAVSMQLSA